MMSYDVYPTLSMAPPLDLQAYQLNIIQSKRLGFLKLGKRCKKKYKKYTKILNRLIWLNTCPSGLSVTSDISSVATLSTFIGLPVSIPSGARSLAGTSVSGIATVVTEKYLKKLLKVAKLTDIITLATAVFEINVSKVLNNGKIDEKEFNVLQTLLLRTLNELSKIYRRMGAENRNQFEKSLP